MIDLIRLLLRTLRTLRLRWKPGELLPHLEQDIELEAPPIELPEFVTESGHDDVNTAWPAAEMDAKINRVFAAIRAGEETRYEWETR